MNREARVALRGGSMKNGNGALPWAGCIVYFILLAFAVFAGGGIFATDSHAYPNYNGGTSTGCQTCHGTFTSNTSPKGTNFGAAGNKHDMHRSSSFMGTACGLCHTVTGDNPLMNSSAGSGGVVGVGCTGCHNGAGLRQHHRVTGASQCSGCHTNPEVAPSEKTRPPYYGTSATKAKNACNPVAQANMNENWTVGDFEGLDNDGNNVYDGSDNACRKNPSLVDFDNDRLKDIAVWRPGNGVWYILQSSVGYNTASSKSYSWGVSTDDKVPGDYDGDGMTDLAIYRPSTGVWYILQSSDGYNTTLAKTYNWGVLGDIPVPGDYDGDGKTDVAVWRPSSRVWFIINSSNGSITQMSWGIAGDVPVPGDFDGDGKTDLAIYRPSTSGWHIINSSNGTVTKLSWGNAGDVTVPADYDGDGKTDIAVYRPSNGIWYILQSSDGFDPTKYKAYSFGRTGDVPVPGNYDDGDGKADIAVYRPSNGIWYILRSADGYNATMYKAYSWGGASDSPVTGLE